MRSLAPFVVATLSLGVARAQQPAVAASAGGNAAAASSGNGSSGARGTVGVHRIEAAKPLGAGELVLTIGGEYSVSESLIVEGDTNERQVQRLTVAWSPVEALEVFLSQKSLTNNNDAFEPGTIQILGDPSFGLKFSQALSDMLGVGAVVDIMLPTSPRGSGLKPDAYRLTLLAAATVSPTSNISASLNAGYVLDNTNDLFVRDIEPVQRYSAGIAKTNQIIAGVGIATDFAVAGFLGVGPFVEVHAGIGSGTEMSENPIIGTGGIKLYPSSRALMEVTLGGDYRLSGAPTPEANLPGLPPWEIFGRVTAHLGFAGDEPVKVAGGPQSCTADAQCSGGQSCLDNMCVTVKEVTKEVVKEVSKAAPTFTVEGAVFDEESGDPISSATVSISGTGTSALAVDPKTGKFKSYGLPTGEGLVQLKAEAPGFRPSESTMPKGADGESKVVTFKLTSLGKDAVGELKGSLKDGRSGNPVKGEIFIPVLAKKFQADVEGKFNASMKAGRYQVLISARGYATQKKEIDIRAGDVVILNVDLNKK
jgi:hypothetical protein